MSYSDKKIWQQIDGCNVEMCKIDTKIKPMPFSSFRKGLNGQGHDVPAVKLDSKWGFPS